MNIQMLKLGSLLALVLSSTQAGALTIDFGPGLPGVPPAGTVELDDQLASLGVRFSTTDPDGVRWRAASLGTYPSSITAGLVTTPPHGIAPITVDFGVPVTDASIRGFDGGADIDALTVSAFDRDGNLVDEQSKTGTFTAGGHVVGVSAPEIVRIVIAVSGTEAGLFYDDLSFTMARIPAKWSQPIGRGTGAAVTGRDRISDHTGNAIMADDFVSDGRPIVAVRWWGSFAGEGPTSGAPRPDGPSGPFDISFHRATGAHPASLPISPTLELHSGLFAWQTIEGDDGNDYVYRYFAVLPTPFPESAGSEYFIDIDRPTLTSTGENWGWHDAREPHPILSPAATAPGGSGHDGPYSTFFPQTELAFELLATDPLSPLSAASFSLEAYSLYAGGGTLDGSFGGGIGTRYFLTKNLGVMARAYWWDADPVMHNITASAVVRYPIQELRIAPYVYGGIGGHFGEENQFGGHVGGGLDYQVNERLGAFADYSHTWTGDSDDWNVVALGIRIHF